jgi:hypothetical protein
LGNECDKSCCKGSLCLNVQLVAVLFAAMELALQDICLKAGLMYLLVLCTVTSTLLQGWYWNGINDDGRLKSETDWLDNVLHPWATRTEAILQDYRQWKSSTNRPSATIDSSTPAVYKKVLHYLRVADSSGMWPSTTAKRQLVMYSTSKDESQVTPLSVAHSATTTNRTSGQSAYSFVEGEGGASGSFSVGVMPDGGCSQPKGNLLFPELVKAAFELEIALMPDRQPSVSAFLGLLVAKGSLLI